MFQFAGSMAQLVEVELLLNLTALKFKTTYAPIRGKLEYSG